MKILLRLSILTRGWRSRVAICWGSRGTKPIKRREGKNRHPWCWRLSLLMLRDWKGRVPFNGRGGAAASSTASGIIEIPLLLLPAGFTKLKARPNFSKSSPTNLTYDHFFQVTSYSIARPGSWLIQGSDLMYKMKQWASLNWLWLLQDLRFYWRTISTL